MRSCDSAELNSCLMYTVTHKLHCPVCVCVCRTSPPQVWTPRPAVFCGTVSSVSSRRVDLLFSPHTGNQHTPLLSCLNGPFHRLLLFLNAATIKIQKDFSQFRLKFKKKNSNEDVPCFFLDLAHFWEQIFPWNVIKLVQTHPFLSVRYVYSRMQSLSKYTPFDSVCKRRRSTHCPVSELISAGVMTNKMSFYSKVLLR